MKTGKAIAQIVRELCILHLGEKSVAAELKAQIKTVSKSVVAECTGFKRYTEALDVYLNNRLKYGNGAERARLAQERRRLPSDLKRMLEEYEWNVQATEIEAAVHKSCDQILLLLPQYELSPEQTEKQIIGLVLQQLDTL